MEAGRPRPAGRAGRPSSIKSPQKKRGPKIRASLKAETPLLVQRMSARPLRHNLACIFRQ